MPVLHRYRIPQGKRNSAFQLPHLLKLLLSLDHGQVVYGKERRRTQGRQELEKHPQELHANAKSSLRVRRIELAHHWCRTGKFQQKYT